MPVAAAAILQRIANFLAVGAVPQASSEAGEEFSLHLARNAPAPASDQPLETGKVLPAGRQDLAGPPIALSATAAGQPAKASDAPATDVTLEPPLATAALLAAAEPPSTAADAATPSSDVQPAPADELPPHPVPHAPMAKAPTAAPIVARLLSSATIEPKVAAAVKPQRTAVPAASRQAVAASPADAAPAPSSDLSVPPEAPDRDVAANPSFDSAALPQPVVSSPVIPVGNPSLDATASPAPPTAVDLATPRPAIATRPQPGRSSHHATRSAAIERDAIGLAKAAPQTRATAAEAASTTAPIATPPLPAPTFTTTVAAAAEPAKTPLAGDPAQPAAAQMAAGAGPPLVTAQVELPLPIATSAPSGPSRQDMTPVLAARIAGADGDAGAASAMPAVAPATAGVPVPTVGASPAETATSDGVTFVARSVPIAPIQAPAAARHPAIQVAERAGPTATSEAAPAPVANPATAAPDGNVAPFRPTAKLILASQPPAAGAPRAAEAETATLRTPLAEAAPTIAHQLAPASHGGDQPALAASPMPALSSDQAAALVETIQMLRSEAKSDAMTLAVDHDELGKITMRFDRADHGVTVRFDSPDPSVTQLIANSASSLKASGDGVGMRFERQDVSGGGAGTSRDAPRQGTGQDRNPTPYAQSSRPRPGGQRDGIFA